ncbi:glycosyltransferase [Arachidicoccus sp.]|uniref:glycosyltransferase n=1 Tax=Arachidicoccus sp. TaxID=1872624 RepID=UPI003D1C7049
MKRVLLISDTLEHYRIPLFESLCDVVNLTIAHSNKINYNTSFKSVQIEVLPFGPFLRYKGLPKLAEFDIVIFPFSFRCFELFKQILSNKDIKIGVFGIGVSASYNKKYDSDRRLLWLRKLILKRVGFAIFYEQYPFIKYSAMGIDASKMSVAFNTVENKINFDLAEKTFSSFIFIGSLYKQKKIFELLNAYLIVYTNHKGNIPRLEIVGDGDQMDEIKNWILSKDLNNSIILHGKLTSDLLLAPIFRRAIACVSPGQAGLSVQKCFSFGVPFITSFNAITGGEAFSIINSVTGFCYDSTIMGLSNILEKFVSNDLDLKKMSNACYIFYEQFRNINIWKEGFLRNVI